MKSDEELLVEAVADQNQYLLAVAIVFASTVDIAVDQNSHEENVCKIRVSFIYMEIISYMLDSY